MTFLYVIGGIVAWVTIGILNLLVVSAYEKYSKEYIGFDEQGNDLIFLLGPVGMPVIIAVIFVALLLDGTDKIRKKIAGR